MRVWIGGCSPAARAARARRVASSACASSLLRPAAPRHGPNLSTRAGGRGGQTQARGGARSCCVGARGRRTPCAAGPSAPLLPPCCVACPPAGGGVARAVSRSVCEQPQQHHTQHIAIKHYGFAAAACRSTAAWRAAAAAAQQDIAGALEWRFCQALRQGGRPLIMSSQCISRVHSVLAAPCRRSALLAAEE
jgi:hypothetical protein